MQDLQVGGISGLFVHPDNKSCELGSNNNCNFCNLCLLKWNLPRTQMIDDNALVGVVAAAVAVVAVVAADELPAKRRKREMWVRPMLQCRQQVGAYKATIC